jgi:uncharacterized membrane-anchored protein
MEAVARGDSRTKRLVRRLRRGEIAVIVHEDLDAAAAEALVAARPAAVVNGRSSLTGEYPAEGAQILIEAKVPVLDDVGPDVLGKFREGERLSLRGARLCRGDEVLAEGEFLNEASIAARLAEADGKLAERLVRFAENTLSYVQQEGPLAFAGGEVPRLGTDLRDRHVVVVTRGPGCRRDLQAISAYIRDVRPVLIGVDGGADLLRESGLSADVIVGDVDSASDEALTGGAEIVVHAYPDGRAPGAERVERLGLDHSRITVRGTSEDAALVLAHELGADLIVLVGGHRTAMDFLGKGREGMSSTFLTRLRVGDKLVDAKGVSKLHQGAPGLRYLATLVAAGLGCAAVVVALKPYIGHFVHIAAARLVLLIGDLWHGLF